MNENRAKLEGQPRVDLLNQEDAVRSAETSLNIATIAAQQSCSKLEVAYSAFQRLVGEQVQSGKLAQGSDTDRRIVVQSNKLRNHFACWSITEDLRAQLDRITHEIALLDGASSSPAINAAIAVLRERWALLDVALRERESAAARYFEEAERMAIAIEKAAITARLRPAERAVLSTSVRTLPKIYIIEQQLRFLADDAGAAADKNQSARPFNDMCSTLKLVETPSPTRLDVTTQSPVELKELAEEWKARLDAVHEAVDQALSVPGAEW